MSCACSHEPNQPCAPNTSTNTRPATTGDTENGRSISEISTCLPRNSNLAMAQAATTPNTRFNGTAMAATSSVSRIADHASGSTSAATYVCQPLRSASMNTIASGITRNSARNASTRPSSSQRTARGSVFARDGTKRFPPAI